MSACCLVLLLACTQEVSAAMQPKLRAAFSLLHLNSLRVSRSAINATFSTLQRRLLSVDPWLPMDTTVSNKLLKTCCAVLCAAIGLDRLSIARVHMHAFCLVSIAWSCAGMPELSQGLSRPCRFPLPALSPHMFLASLQVSSQDGMSPMDGEGDVTWLPVPAAVDIPDDVYLRGEYLLHAPFDTCVSA